MASSIGSKIQQFAVSVLIGLLVIGFAIWGISDVFSPSASNSVVQLGDEDISTQEFNDAFRRRLTVMARQDGRQMTDQEAFNQGIHQQVLSELVTNKVVEIDADDLGIGVNSKAARDFVSDIDVFQDELTGEFSEQKLRETLARMNPPMSRRQFEQDLINDLRLQQTIPAITGGVTAPLEFAQLSYKYLTEQRRAEVLTLTRDAVPAPAEPTDEELRTFIDDNPIPFTAPEYRKVTLLRLENYHMTPDIEVTEEELRASFDYKVELGEVGSAAKRSLVQITAQDQENAEEIAQRLADGESPEDIVALMSLVEPVEYDSVTEAAILDPETGTAAFDMQEGETRALLGSFGNWYAIQVTGVTEAVVPNFDNMREELETELLDEKAQQRIYDFTDIIEDTMIEGNTIEEAALAADVPFESIDFIDRSGATQDGRRLTGFDGLEGIAQDENILTEIFTNELGYETDIFQTSTGGWAAIRVDDIIDSQLRPFEEVREQATEMYKNEKVEEALDELMLDLAGQAQQGTDLQTLAAEAGDGASVDTVILVRSSQSRTLGPVVNAGLLQADIGDIERGPGNAPFTRQIAKLTDIVENTDALAGQIADSFQEQMTGAIRSDLQNAYQNAVLEEYPLREYPDQVRQTLGLDDQG